MMVCLDRQIAHILFVDDSRAEVALMRALLRRERICFEFTCVRSGVAAMQYLRQEGAFSESKIPDLILLDINMPSVDGFEVLENMKQDNCFKDIPVFMYSGSKFAKDQERAALLGADGYISKPMNFDKLYAALQHIPTLKLSTDGHDHVLECV